MGREVVACLLLAAGGLLLVSLVTAGIVLWEYFVRATVGDGVAGMSVFFAPVVVGILALFTWLVYVFRNG